VQLQEVIAMEYDISKITDKLYVSSLLKKAAEPCLRSQGIRMIISMIFFYPPPAVFSEEPYESLWLPTFDFPLLPIPLRMLQKGVERALPVLEDGRSVLVFCRQGRHRSVAMAASILIGMNYSSSEAMAILKSGRRVADPDASHIKQQILRFEKQWIAMRGINGGKL